MEFFTSVFQLEKLPTDLPQIALFGRSNVGKSSFINAYANRKQLAKVSKTPGKTIGLNFFKEKNYYLVDCPGYGYAKRDDKTRNEILALINGYLNKKNIDLALLFIDFKVGPTSDDLTVLNYLIQSGLSYKVILTKVDKVKSSIEVKTLRNIKDKLGNVDFIKVSSEKKIGIDLVKKLINERFGE